MPYKSFSFTATGISHTKHGKGWGCEDFSLHHPPYGAKSDTPVVLAVIADGHGDDNCFRSAKGAKFAAIAAKEAIIEFAAPLVPGSGLLKKAESIQAFSEDLEKNIRESVKHIVQRIIEKWRGEVEKDYTANPVTNEEMANVREKYKKHYAAGKDLHHAYGTTLIAAAIIKDYWFGIHIGDGRFTVLNHDGTFDQPIPWDDRCFLNITTSICADDALEKVRTHYALTSDKPPPVAIFLCSDGVDDNYSVDENEKHLYHLYRIIAFTFVDDGFESTCYQLKDLANSFVTKGKGDDTSIAGIIDMEAVKTIASLLRKQAEENDQKAAAEKAAKAEAVPVAVEKATTERVARIAESATQ